MNRVVNITNVVKNPANPIAEKLIMSFQIHALPEQDFQHLFSLSDQQLKKQNAVRMTVTSSTGSPCRVSLEDAKVGEEVILVNYQHQPASSPYQATHAVFIRKDRPQAFLADGEVPILMRHRLMSLRAFDKTHMMVEAEAVGGADLEWAIESLFNIPEVEYIHLHYAKPGCFAARVSRT